MYSHVKYASAISLMFISNTICQYEKLFIRLPIYINYDLNDFQLSISMNPGIKGPMPAG